MDGPVQPTGIEKFVFLDGSSKLVYLPRIAPFLNGRQISGNVCDSEGKILHTTTLFPLANVMERYGMDWSHSKVALVQGDSLPLETGYR